MIRTLSREWILPVVCSFLLAWPAAAQNVNDAANPQQRSVLDLGGGRPLSINDLLRAADLLDSQRNQSNQDPGKSLDKAIDRFNQSRQQRIQIGPANAPAALPSPAPSPAL